MSLLLRILLVLTVFFTPLTAAAADVTLLANGPVVGDGKTPATLQLWIPGITGADRVKVKADEGRSGDAEISADGLVTVSIIPPSVKTPRDLGVSVKVQGASLRVDERVNLALVPPYAGALKVTFDPPDFVAGNSGVLVRFTPDASTPQSAEARRVVALASEGTLDAPVASGDGTFVARWTPPASLPRSRTVIFTASDSAAPDQVTGWGVLPVLVKQSVTLNAAPGSNNVLVAGDRQWGPLPASPAGTVAFDVEVHPGKTTARLQSVAPDGTKTETVSELPLEDYPRLAFFPLPSAVPADPNTHVTVRVVATKRSGEPLSNAPISLRATAGQLTPAVASGSAGVYEATFSPPDTAGEAIFSVEVDGHKAEARMKIVASLPSVSLSSDPEELTASKTTATITARVKDSRGGGLIGRAPDFSVQGGALSGRAVDNKDGTYTQKVTLGSKSSFMLVTASPPVEPSGLAAQRLLLWTGRQAVPANGAESISVTVAAVDAYGLPVPGVKIRLSVPVGDGTLPPEATTDSRGLARLSYRAGVSPGPATLRADGAGLWTSGTIFQVGPGMLAPSLGSAGSPDAAAALATWQMAAPALVVAREGAAQSAKAGPPAVVTLSTVPPYTTPGAAILVVVRVSDAAGIPAPKQKINLSSSLGTVGALTDNGDGSYAAPVQLPAGQDGPITLTAAVGSVQGSVVLPTLMGMNAAMTAGEAAAPTARTSGGASTSKPARKPRSGGGGGGGDMPWARFEGSLETVARTYRQTLLEANGSTNLPDEVPFKTGALFGAPGLDARAQLWPGNGSFGVVFRGRGYLDRVAIGADNYSKVGGTLHGGLRYRAEVSPGLYAFGSAEAQLFSALVLAYTDEAKTSAEMVSKNLGGARIGGGIQAHPGSLFFEAQLTETLAPWPVDTGIGIGFALDLPSGLSPRIGFDWDLRSMAFMVDDDKVRVRDQERALMLGVGYVFQ